jgi:membrane protein YdbS with pleckstrin-like domain
VSSAPQTRHGPLLRLLAIMVEIAANDSRIQAIDEQEQAEDDAEEIATNG